MKRSFFAILILSVLFASCEKATQFTIDYNTTITVPANNSLSLPFDAFSPEVTTNSESKFKSNETTKKHVEHIELRELKLSILSPEGQNFDFLKSIDLYINADGLEEKKVAFIESVPENKTELDLDVVEGDLQAYIKSDEYTLRSKVVTDETINEDVEINAYSKFWVDAKIAN